jgi:excisionase family DNA binding protein
MKKGDLMFTTNEVAEMLDVTPGRVRQIITDGLIQAERKGRDLLIPHSEIAKAMARKTKPGPTPATKRAGK